MFDPTVATKEIKPCPFCSTSVVSLKTLPGSRYKVVHCNKCGSTGPKSVNNEYAIEWWNRRDGK